MIVCTMLRITTETSIKSEAGGCDASVQEWTSLVLLLPSQVVVVTGDFYDKLKFKA